MADFNKYAPILKALEGGFVNDPNDKGGATNCGVTIGTFRDFFGKDKTVEDLKRMTESQWRKVMYSYWRSAGCDSIENQSIAELIADWCIHSGLGILRKVQSIAGTAVDGKIGPKSIAAINGFRQKCLHCQIWDARREFLIRVAETNPQYKGMLKGWMNRLERFRFSE